MEIDQELGETAAERAADSARKLLGGSLDVANGSSANHYDAIVFGSGASGLTCATTLAKYGLRTMLAEKNPWYGGYAHGFGKDGFYWDHGGHIFLAYRLGKQAREVFYRLGLHERVEMVPDQHDYRCIFPGESMEVPAEMSAAADVMAERFPAEREGIAKVFMIMERMIDEVDLLVPSFRVQAKPGQRKLIDPVLEQFQRPWLGDLMAPVARATRFPGNTLLTYQNTTFNQLLDEHLNDPLLKAYFSMLCVGIAAAPAELSAVIAGVFFVHALRTMWMPKGGFGKLAEALGDDVPGARRHDRDRRRGDSRRRRERPRARDRDRRRPALHRRRRRLGLRREAALPRHARRRTSSRPTCAAACRGMKTTPAFFQVQLGVDMDLEPYREQIKRLNFIYPYPDIDRAMANFPNGNVEEAAYYLYVATFHQPEMAPPGQALPEARVPDDGSTRRGSTGSATGRRSRTRSSAAPRRSSPTSRSTSS